jgi:hypothetical protein
MKNQTLDKTNLGVGSGSGSIAKGRLLISNSNFQLAVQVPQN